MSITAIVGSESLCLSDGNPFWLTGCVGVGMSPLHVITSRGSEQHGETRVDFRLDPRTFSVVLGMALDSASDLQTHKDELIAFLVPWGDSLLLEWVLANGNVRRISCMRRGDGDMSTADKQGFMQKAAIEFHAADPTFYDPVVGVSSFDLGGGAGGTIVPTPIPMSVGASTIDQVRVVAYPGSAPSSPVIRITGPITNPVITNETTGKVLSLTGYTIAQADYYDIDTRYGHQTVKDAAGASQIAKLTDASDLGTFALAPWPVAPGGVNSIRVTGTAINNLTSVIVTWWNRYLGI